MTPPKSWLTVVGKAKIIKEKIAVKNGSIVRIAAVLDISKTSRALKNKAKLKTTPVTEPKNAKRSVIDGKVVSNVPDRNAKTNINRNMNMEFPPAKATGFTFFT